MNRVIALTEPEMTRPVSTKTGHGKPRVVVVDTGHVAWQAVLRSIVRTGGADSLLICDDGRLSARQTVLAAIDDGRVVGHLVFHIEPGTGRSLRAQLDSFDVDSDADVEEQLLQTADEQATVRRCARPELIAC